MPNDIKGGRPTDSERWENPGKRGIYESTKWIAKTFYPEDDEMDDNADHQTMRKTAEEVNIRKQNELCNPMFTIEELDKAARSLNPK